MWGCLKAKTGRGPNGGHPHMVKKRAYRAVNVNRLEAQRLLEDLGGECAICGIDVAKKDFVAAFMNASLKVVLVTVKWKHPEETGAFLALLEDLGVDNVEVAIESSGSYGTALHYQLEKRRIPVFRVSTKRSHDAAELYDGVPSSHDAKSAALLAWLHCDDLSERWELPSPEARALSAQGKRHEELAGYAEQLTNRLEAMLAAVWPELLTLLQLSSLTLPKLISEFGGPQGVAADPHGARELMRRVSRGNVRPLRAESIIESAVHSLGLPMVPQERESLVQLAQELMRVRELLRDSEETLVEQARRRPELGAMSTAVGGPTAARVAAITGNPARLDSAHAFEKTIGLNLKERSSGMKAGRLAITKRGSGSVRKLLFLAAIRLVRSDPIVRAWHERKKARDGGLGMRSIVAVMRKLARALWHLAKHGGTFDSAKLFDTRRLSAPA